MTLKEFEQKRLALLAVLDKQKTKLQRNQLGQFATPSHLANEILNYAHKLVQKPVDFFDPAVGTGTFYSALANKFKKNEIRTADGFEIDSHYAIPSIKLWEQHDFSIKIEDFTSSTPDKKYNLIICNPPYVRHQHLTKEQKISLCDKTFEITGLKLSGLAGLYCHFMLQSHAWMAEDAIAAWLIPSEFMDVNYGAQVREYLLKNVTLLKIHRFDPSELQFSDALVSSAIVWIKKCPPNSNHKVSFSYGGTLSSPHIEKKISNAVLEQEYKWSRFPLSEVRTATTSTTLGDIFNIRRGIATGDNKFFILDEKTVSEYNIPSDFLTYVLPSPKDIEGFEVASDHDGAPVGVKKLFLLNIKMSEDEVALYPQLYKYLALGKEMKVNEGYLCKNRKRWYEQETRDAPAIICTYMGRENSKSGRPFRFIRNRSLATVTNSYLALYLKPEFNSLLLKDPNCIERIWTKLNEIAVEDLLGEGRTYGGGLVKLEPKELAKVPVQL